MARTADTEHKAWRKRQIAYKLAKRGSVTHAVTDVILCSKMKIAPNGFAMAGEINGIMVCYKIGAVTLRAPPSIPVSVNDLSSLKDLENSLLYINISMKPTNRINSVNNINNKSVANNKSDNDYEVIRTSYQLSPPARQAPKPPAIIPLKHHGTLGHHTDMDGVPFILNPNLSKHQMAALDVSLIPHWKLKADFYDDFFFCA